MKMHKMCQIGLVAAMTLLAAGCQTQEQVQQGAAAIVGDEASLLKQADTHKALGHDKEAMAYYEAAVAQSTGGVRGHLELANLYHKAGRLNDAVAVLRKANDLNPTSVEVLNALAQGLLESGQGQEAGRYLARGLGKSPSDTRLIIAYGVWLDQMGQHANAQENYRNALKLARTPDETYRATNNLALSLVADKKADAAIALLQKLPSAQKDQPSYRQLLALAYGVKGDKEKAYELALEDLSAEEARQNLEIYERLHLGTLDSKVLFQNASKAP